MCILNPLNALVTLLYGLLLYACTLVENMYPGTFTHHLRLLVMVSPLLLLFATFEVLELARMTHAVETEQLKTMHGKRMIRQAQIASAETMAKEEADEKATRYEGWTTAARFEIVRLEGVVKRKEQKIEEILDSNDSYSRRNTKLQNAANRHEGVIVEMTNNYNDVIVEMTKNYNDVVAKLTEEANRDLAGELDTAIKAKEAAEADKKAAETDKHAAEAGKTAAEARIRVFENGFMKFDEERVNFENRIAEMDLKYDNLMAQHEQMVGIANEMYMTKTKEIEALNFEAQTYMTKTKEIEDLNFEVAALQAINKQLNVPGEAEIQHLREVVRERDMELAAIKPKLQHAIIAQNTLSKQLKKGGHDEEDWDNLHDNLKLIRRQNGEMKAKISEITKQHSDLSQNFKKASEKAKTATTLADQLKDQLRRANDQIEELEYDEEAALSIFTKSKPENRGRSPITGLLFSEPQTPADKLPGQLRLPPLLRNGPFGFPLAPESILPPRVKGKIPGLFALPPASPPMPDARMDIERAPAVGVAAQTPHIKDDFVPLPSSFVPLEQFFQSAEDEGPVVPASHKRRRARGL